jgi:hypothetical protein
MAVNKAILGRVVHSSQLQALLQACLWITIMVCTNSSGSVDTSGSPTRVECHAYPVGAHEVDA